MLYFKITPEVYHHFQLCSGDMNPLHTDEDFARHHGFPSCVMYGNILNAFVSYFVGMTLPDKNVMILSQDLNYRKPLYMNDEVKLVTTVDSRSEAVQVVVYKLKFYRITSGEKEELVANGHVQVRIISDKQQ